MLLEWNGDFALKYPLLNWKCHYFSNECMGLKKTTLSLLKYVTNILESVWVNGNWLDVTKYEDVFLRWPNTIPRAWPYRPWSSITL